MQSYLLQSVLMTIAQAHRVTREENNRNVTTKKAKVKRDNCGKFLSTLQTSLSNNLERFVGNGGKRCRSTAVTNLPNSSKLFIFCTGSGFYYGKNVSACVCWEGNGNCFSASQFPTIGSTIEGCRFCFRLEKPYSLSFSLSVVEENTPDRVMMMQSMARCHPARET